MKRLLSLLSLALVSCGETHTGGFETTDLQARVVRPDGTPVSAARAWLVRSSGESSPAMVVDSGFTDAAGMIHFAAPPNGLSGLGVDAAARDSIGLSPRSLEGSSTSLVVLRSTHRVSIAADTSGAARCFVPGSHFASTIASDGSTAVLDLPNGTWNLVVRRGSVSTLRSIVLTTDTLLAGGSDSRMDTTSPGGATILAARIQAQTLEGLELDVINTGTNPFDSLALRLYLAGTPAELADFAVRLDLAQSYDANGISKPAALDVSSWARVHPHPLEASCPSATTCTWTLDLPLVGTTVDVAARLHLSVLFDRHILTGDSSQYANSRPTHDPFSGQDWSFRARTWADSASNPSGLPDYAGVPAASGTGLPPTAPYMILLRKDRLIAGKPPSPRL